MRVTDASIYLLQNTALNASRTRMADAQLRAATGLRVVNPSDDPIATALARERTARANRADSHLRAGTTATTVLQSADASLNEVGAVLNRLRELAVQMSNDTISPEQRLGSSTEVDELFNQIVSLANTEANGQFIFAGFLDGAPPFDATGTYAGDANRKQLEVAQGVRIEVTLTGDEVFGAAGGIDIFQAVSDFANALRTNDEPNIRAALETIEDSLNQVTNARSQLGSRAAAVEVARSSTERVQNRAVDERSQLIEIDPFVAYSDVARAQQALQAAVQVASLLPLPGLVER